MENEATYLMSKIVHDGETFRLVEWARPAEITGESNGWIIRKPGRRLTLTYELCDTKSEAENRP